jgi:hypothetical protein
MIAGGVVTVAVVVVSASPSNPMRGGGKAGKGWQMAD